jgi:hypothetical protein
MVPADGTHQLDQQVFVVNTLKETAVYVERMPGGVRGGGREASPLLDVCQAWRKSIGCKSLTGRSGRNC